MPYLYAMDFINVLKQKHAAGGYKEMVNISIFLLDLDLKMMPLISW